MYIKLNPTFLTKFYSPKNQHRNKGIDFYHYAAVNYKVYP